MSRHAKQEEQMGSVDISPGYYLTPVAGAEDGSAEETIRKLVGQGRYVFDDRAPCLKLFKPGDRICFYVSGVGVAAEAKILSPARRSEVPFARGRRQFPFECSIGHARFFFDQPIKIDSQLRSRLDAFKDRDPNRNWALFVRTTKRVTERDFAALVGRRLNKLGPAPT